MSIAIWTLCLILNNNAFLPLDAFSSQAPESLCAVSSLPPSFRFPPLREGNQADSVPPVYRGNLKEGVAIETSLDEPEIPPATGSLWDDRAGSLYDDFKARRVGDLVTIVVVENTTASARANTAVQKSESASTTAGVGPLLNFLWPELGASGKTDSNTQGNTARAGTLQTRITVQVVETFPNGVLRIEGRRTLKINEETQTLVFSGLVRIRDIRADNTVPSTAIANAEIYFEGKGIVGSRQREGILTRLFKIIF
jgi:flagellar L-ring protein precursor FlgH